MSSTSNASSSGSSAANTVVVTARDIEFSNYNSSTGKWGNAVLTMMIEDANTPENLNLEVYDERVYAVFRNHDDPTDTIQTSAEVDGMDFRVTISTPMVASGKYELYKVYGETSGNEYATSSQFYIQVPGRVWDFANDVVEEDTELVSDWFNYGEIEDVNGNVYGAVTQTEMSDATWATSTQTFTINGVTLTPADVKRVKLTSLVSGKYGSKMNTTYNRLSANFCNGWNNLTDLDVVSSRITYIGDTDNATSDGLGVGIRGTSFNKKFAFPETLRVICGWLYTVNIFNKPLYIPDSVNGIISMMMNSTGTANYTSKIRFSPNIRYMVQGQNYGPFASLTNWAGSRKGLSSNVQLTRLSDYSGGSVTTFYGLKDTPWTEEFQIPSVWTYIPSVMFAKYDFSSEIVIPSNITEIKEYAFYLAKLKRIILPSSITSIRDNFMIDCGVNNGNGLILDGLENTQITSLPAGFLSGPAVNVSLLNIPSRVTAYPNNMFNTATFLYSGIILANKDDDGYFTYNIPEGIRTIGSNFLSERTSRTVYDQGTYGRVNRIVLPSTLTSVGVGFCGKISSSQWSSSRNTYAVIVDATKVSPSIFQDNDTTSFAASYNTTSDWYEDVQIIVASGTTEEWQSKLPDITTGLYKRRINWVEPSTEYGKLVYYPNYTTTWGISSYAGTRSGDEVRMYEVEEFEDWVGSLSPAPYISEAGDLRFDSPNGQDLQYTDINGDTQTIEYGVWEIRGVSLNFEYSARERYVVFNNSLTISTVDQTSTAEVELTSMAQYNSLCMSGIPSSSSSYTIDMTTRITVGADSTVIPIACIKSYEFGTVPTTIPNYFLVASSVESVNMRHANITTIGDGFLCDCGYFNSNVDLTGVTSVGTNFLSKCELFNGTLGDISSLTSIGTRFLYDCRSFNHPIQLPSAITSLDAFMSSCYAFNYPLDFSHITTIGDNVLYGCRAFNYSLDLSNVTSVGNYFLANCNVYNQPVTIANVTAVGESFLRGCSMFNSQVSLPNCTTFGRSFMQYCTIFNQPLDTTNITNCGSGFLLNCTAFNQPLDLSNLVDAGTASDYGGFLNHCDAFNQPLNLPKIRYFGGLNYMASFNSDVTFGPDLAKLSIWSFAYNDKMCKTYNFGTVNPTNVQINNSYYNSLFVTTNSSTDAYVNGVKIAGTYRSAWMSKCPNNSSGTFTRKLVNAGY